MKHNPFRAGFKKSGHSQYVREESVKMEASRSSAQSRLNRQDTLFTFKPTFTHMYPALAALLINAAVR